MQTKSVVLRGGGRTNDAVVGKVLLGIFVDVRSMKQGLGGDATNVEAGTAELAALLNACDLTRKNLLDYRLEIDC
jgi:hypothetical protein